MNANFRHTWSLLRLELTVCGLRLRPCVLGSLGLGTWWSLLHHCRSKFTLAAYTTLQRQTVMFLSKLQQYIYHRYWCHSRQWRHEWKTWQSPPVSVNL